MRLPYLVFVAIAAPLIVTACINSAQAILTTTNGGFDAQGAEVNNVPTVSPTGWFVRRNDADTFSDALLYAPTGNQGAWDFNGLLLGNDTPFPTDGTTELGYAYQSIGTYSGESNVTVTGQVFNRVNSNFVGDFDVALFYSDPGTFTPGNGVDLTGSAAVLIGELTFTEGIEFPAITGVIPQSVDWSAAFNLSGSGVTSGDTIWLRLGDGGRPDPIPPAGAVSDQPVLDNINIFPFTLGDTGTDGIAGLNDLQAIRANFRKTTSVTRAMGDLDGSGDVDFKDYLQWREAYLEQNPAVATAPGLFTVPEPAGLALIGFGALALVGFRGGRCKVGTPLMIAAVLSLGAAAQTSYAADNVFFNSGSYTDPNNWADGEVPSASNNYQAIFDNNAIATLSSPAPSIGGVIIGQQLGFTGALNIGPGGSLTTTDESAPGVPVQTTQLGNFAVGVAAGGTGTLTMTGGTLTIDSNRSITSAANPMNLISLSGSATLNTPLAQFSGTTRVTGSSVNFNAANFTLQGAHTLVAGISAANHSPLRASGVATVGGTASADFSGIFAGVAPAFGQKFNLIDAAAIAGSFSNANNIPVVGVPAPVLGEVYRVTKASGGTFGQVLQLSREQALVLQVNRGTGEMSIINPLNGPINIDGYQVRSTVGSLEPSTWNSFANQGDFGWDEGFATGNSLGELNVGSSFNFSGVPTKALGAAYDEGNSFFVNGIGAVGNDLTFSYSLPSGTNAINGTVQYVGTARTNTLVLTINQSTGTAVLKNDAPGAITIDGYSILSNAGALLPGGFLDSATPTISALPGTNTIDAISELTANPASPLVIAAGASYNLGGIFNTASAAEGISLEFVASGLDTLYNGVVRFQETILGDYSGDGVVNAADYTVWRDNLNQPAGAFPGRDPANAANPINNADFEFWKSRYGATENPALAAAVPEPTGVLSLLIGVGVFAAGRARRGG